MRSLLAIAMVVAAGSLAAQQDVTKIVSGATVILSEGGCPVGFSAEVSARAVVHSAKDDEDRDTTFLEIRFVPGDKVRVVRAKVTVHGLPVGSRLIPVGEQDVEMTSEKFELTSAAGLSGREIRVPKLAVVRWAEVTEMRYADGTIWRSSKEEVCRAKPSLFRPVNAVVGLR